MANTHAEARARIAAAGQSGSTYDFWAARTAVEALSPGPSKDQQRAAIRKLPLNDHATWMIARAVEATLDTAQNRPEVVGQGNGLVTVSLRRTERTFAAEESGRAAAVEATATIEAASGVLAVSSLAITSHDPVIGTMPLPVTEGRLDVAGVRGWNEALRRVYAVPAALIAPPEL